MFGEKRITRSETQFRLACISVLRTKEGRREYGESVSQSFVSIFWSGSVLPIGEEPRGCWNMTRLPAITSYGSIGLIIRRIVDNNGGLLSSFVNEILNRERARVDGGTTRCLVGTR